MQHSDRTTQYIIALDNVMKGVSTNDVSGATHKLGRPKSEVLKIDIGEMVPNITIRGKRILSQV